MIETPTDGHSTVAARLVGPRDATDETLLLDYRSTGDPRLFAELVRRYEHELFGYLRRFLGDATLAEDTFQLTFLQVHLKCGQFQVSRKVRPWLYTIATNQAIDAQRRNRRHRMASLDRDRHGQVGNDDTGRLSDLLARPEPDAIEQLESDEDRDWVHNAIADLPSGLRTALTLVYFQSLRYREAAEVLSIPVGTVKSRVHSAILKLGEAWAQCG
jgi:RNA polymerase sigma-70 factor (ECF subfamily)